MAATKTISFRVSEETYDHVKKLWPDGVGKEENFLSLLNAFEENPKLPIDNADSAFKEYVLEILGLENNISEKDLTNILLELKATEPKTESDNTLLKQYINFHYQIAELLNVDPESENLIIEITEKVKAKNRSESYLFSLFKAYDVENVEQLFNKINSNKNNTEQDFDGFIVKPTLIAEALLKETEERLSIKYDKTITRQDILIDMFLRYTILQWTEWFYPFCISNTRIVQLINEINPELKNIDQIKTHFKGGCKE